MLQLFTMLGICFVLVEALMLALWCLYLIRQNISIGGMGWGIGFILTIIVYFFLGEGFFWRKTLILTLVVIWGFRLSWHLARRYIPNRDDPRFRMGLEKWPYSQHPHLQVLALYLLQGLLITILSLPFALMCLDILPFFNTTEMFGLLIWMIGFCGVTVADSQLKTFKNDPDHHGKVFKEGLWKYSRHPNYFFESIVWLGYAIMALSAPYGWLGFISPLLMLYLLRFVSGVPLSEAHALATRGDSYREYQKETNTFLPWFSYRS